MMSTFTARKGATGAVEQSPRQFTTTLQRPEVWDLHPISSTKFHCYGTQRGIHFNHFNDLQNMRIQHTTINVQLTCWRGMTSAHLLRKWAKEVVRERLVGDYHV